MELREFAEQVLFATRLEEKLVYPEVITDERPGAALAAPKIPGRPLELRFKPQTGATNDFPGVRRLEQENERGRLLHFFTNHELLATELMALVLLRFPDAPAAFRRGVLQTLKDEQRHTQLYLERMKACGVHFGQLPVSGYFWRSVATMSSPMDYVAGLSLTFEQANLDFCRQFARGFSAVGDQETARLLERICRDEIGHVAYGLKWFRRWKDPQVSDWEAFRRQLKFPLSPSRAKGMALNIEGRRAAGLDPEFIAELNIYSQSKGRTPSVFLFNPFAEGYIAYGKAYTPVKHQALLAQDLANLPQFLARQDDLALVPARPSVQFLSGIKQTGFPLPEFVELNRMHELTGRKLGRLRPWAWGPDSVELLEPLFPSVTGEQRKSGQCFNAGIAQLYSKAWSAQFLSKILEQWKGEPWLCTEAEVGVAVTDLEAALDVIAAIRGRGHHRVVAKQALGLAGHNSIRLWEPELLESQRQWLARAFENGRQLVLEPWLEREMDFSVQLEMESGGLRLCGYTGLLNDNKGQYQGNFAEPAYARRIPSRIQKLFREPPDIAARLQRLYADIATRLEVELRRLDYQGPLGLDAFVYRSPTGECRLKPVVELNPRYTMGRLTIELMKRTCPGSQGVFRLVNRAQAKRERFETFPDWGHSLQERCPLRLEGEPMPRIRSGAICLNDPAQAQVCLAVFQVIEPTDRRR
jgi:uncharacterized ferritin-like protein (DUF455 family)